MVVVDLDQEPVVRRICHYILGFKATIEAELSSLSREKKEYCKVRDFFVQVDGLIDTEACDLLGQLMLHKKARFELEMICGELE